MSRQPAKKPQRVQLGKPIEWSEQDLNDLSTVTQADIKAASALWERDAPKKYKLLLQSDVVEVDRGQS